MRRLFPIALLAVLSSCRGWSPTAPSTSLFGTVTDAQFGYRVAGAEVVLSGTGGGVTYADGNGSYAIRDVRAGHYRLNVYVGPAGGHLALQTELDLHDGANLYDIQL